MIIMDDERFLSLLAEIQEKLAELTVASRGEVTARVLRTSPAIAEDVISNVKIIYGQAHELTVNVLGY
jgi:hypothetical protein